MKILPLILSFIFIPLSAFAESDDWNYIWSSKKDDVYMKTESVKVNNDFYNSVNAWVKYVDQANKGYNVAKIQYYCKSDSFKVLESYLYKGNGDYIGGSNKSADIQNAIPDTIGVNLTEAACISAALSELLRYHYMDNGDITDDHYKKVIFSFGEYSMPAMLYYNERTGNTN